MQQEAAKKWYQYFNGSPSKLFISACLCATVSRPEGLKQKLIIIREKEKLIYSDTASEGICTFYSSFELKGRKFALRRSSRIV